MYRIFDVFNSSEVDEWSKKINEFEPFEKFMCFIDFDKIKSKTIFMLV